MSDKSDVKGTLTWAGLAPDRLTKNGEVFTAEMDGYQFSLNSIHHKFSRFGFKVLKVERVITYFPAFQITARIEFKINYTDTLGDLIDRGLIKLEA